MFQEKTILTKSEAHNIAVCLRNNPLWSAVAERIGMDKSVLKLLWRRYIESADQEERNKLKNIVFGK